MREAHGDKPLALFMDNLAAHRTIRARERMRELDIRPIFNIVYQCQLNPIELVFSKIKHVYKTLRHAKIVRGVKPNPYTLIGKAVRAI